MNFYLVTCAMLLFQLEKKYARGGALPPPPTRPRPMVMAIIFRFIDLSIHHHRGTPRCILHIRVHHQGSNTYIGINKNLSGKNHGEDGHVSRVIT